MGYILRTENGTVLSNEEGEKVFLSKEEAENYLALLEYSTTENWKLILREDNLVE